MIYIKIKSIKDFFEINNRLFVVIVLILIFFDTNQI